MPTPRPHPFDLVFSNNISVFQKIRAALAQAGQDPSDRDGFLMLREVVQLLRELRPDEGLGEGIDQLAALVHHCYLYWAAESRTVGCEPDQLNHLLAIHRLDHVPEPRPYYTRFPERRIWAQPVPGEPHEPLDGCFVYPEPNRETLRVLGVFGVHRDRAGFSVVEVAGPRPGSLVRQDGTEPFSPTLPGGAAAGLYSIAGEEELLDLGWRSCMLAAAAAVEAG
jgi:hypothetical protein